VSTLTKIYECTHGMSNSGVTQAKSGYTAAHGGKPPAFRDS
jgi:hypothetical protein